MPSLLTDIRACTLCAGHLPHGVRPIVQASAAAKILIAGQAPGRRVHESGIPFDDASGDRLRMWLGLDRETFYDPTKIAILPMGFCYPGTGKAGDLAPRPECAATWRKPLLDTLPGIKLTILVGQYALDWHLGDAKGASLTETVRNWRAYAPGYMPLPHPSPRNNIWLSRNPWFAKDVLPSLQNHVKAVIQ